MSLIIHSNQIIIINLIDSINFIHFGIDQHSIQTINTHSIQTINTHSIQTINTHSIIIIESTSECHHYWFILLISHICVYNSSMVQSMETYFDNLN